MRKIDKICYWIMDNPGMLWVAAMFTLPLVWIVIYFAVIGVLTIVGM